MAKITSVEELDKLITALIPTADVVVNFEDNQVIVLTNLYVDLDKDPNQLLTRKNYVNHYESYEE